MALPDDDRAWQLVAPYLYRRRGTRNLYARVRIPMGSGLKGSLKARSLKTSNEAEAKRRLPHVVADLKAEIAAAKLANQGDLKVTTTAKERDAQWWRDRLTKAGGGDPRMAPDALIEEVEREAERILGAPVGSAVGPDGEPEEAFDPQRERAALQFLGAAKGDRVEVGADVERYLTEAGHGVQYADRTRRAVTRLGAWLKARPGGDDVSSVTKRAAGEFVDYLLGQKLTTPTVNSLVSALSGYWVWRAQRLGDEQANPWVRQTRRAKSSEGLASKRPFTDPEAVALLNGKTYLTLHDLMRIAALSGMRLEEIARLTVADTSGDEFNIRAAKTKAGVRRVPIHSALAPLVARRTAGKSPTDYLFDELKDPPAGGKKERSSKASERFTAYRRSVGVDERSENQRQSDVDFHSWRRWFVTKAEQAGQFSEIVSAVVGHQRAGMTLGTYSGGPSADQRRAVVEAVRLPAGAPTESPPGPRMGEGRWPGGVEGQG